MASVAGRGAQVRLDGADQAAARGALASTLDGNVEAKRVLEFTGVFPDGSTPDGSSLDGDPAQDNLLFQGAPVGPCKFGNVQTRMPFWGGAVTLQDNSSELSTYAQVMTAECEFDYVRLVFLNHDTVSRDITAAAVAPSASLNDRVNPTNSSNVADPTLWVPVTFNNGGASQDTVVTTGTTRTVTCAAGVVGSVGSNAYQPSVTLSDWIACTSLPRLDGTNLRFLMMRVYWAGSLSVSNPSSLATTSGTAWDTYANGRIIRAPKLTGGDYATTPGAVATWSNSNGKQAIAGFQYMSRKRGLSCLTFGDSLFQGYGGSLAQYDPFQIAAAALSTPEFPVTVGKGAFGGSSSVNFEKNAYKYCAALKPDVVFFKTETPNDGQTTKASWDASLGRAIAFCEWATRQGIVPVLNTAQPWGYTTTREAFRLAHNAAVRASGWLYIDMDAVLSNGGAPAVIQPQYDSPTFSPHYGDAGAAALAKQAVVPVLQRIMSQRPR